MNELLVSIQACPLLAGLGEEARQALASLCRSRTYSAGEIIYPPGSVQSSLCIIADGRVRICSSNAGGREAILAILDVGAWFGDTVFSPGMPRVFGATAHSDSRVVEIPGEGLRSLLQRYPEGYPTMLDQVSRRLWSAMSVIQDDVLRGTEARIGRRLLFLAQMHNRTGTAGGQSVSFALTRELLANMMGMTRQGVHGVLKNIENQGLIEFAYGRVTIADPARLQRYVDGLD
ncbi:Crp/Fnr family transcriptional regulator [Microbulbifer sp. CAU 1566]|uniref:Crp/Fnr family transcriptional regulator n=1 Tax=Microbulbifer sp. CAU 1566 TaxID=2933269 RepID=UPI0020065ACC|nr:Crp/Fnr family transcriptional regulator [Microbulbifer sp. CAU 1566]MCK7596361.1 Crp/Fnr family transcriptional regulator [Microbulbifer sp. CAU 1566]